MVQQWLSWYQALLSEPVDTLTPWVPERMEYEFAVSAATPNGELVVNAAEYTEGRLDWYDFSLRPGASLGASPSEARYQDIRQGTVPSPVSFPGMPANRWWEFEDRQIDFGAVSVDPEDLVSLVMVDEMANLAWAIERVVENRAGARVDRRDAYQQQRESAATPTSGAYR